MAKTNQRKTKFRTTVEEIGLEGCLERMADLLGVPGKMAIQKVKTWAPNRLP
jgi:hypothetical protein